MAKRRRIRHGRATANGVLALCLTVAMAVGCGSDSAPPADASLPDANPAVAVADVAPPTLRTSPAEARALFDAGSAVFVDVRGDDAHRATRIPRAISIPLEALDARILGLDPAQTIVTYCT